MKKSTRIVKKLLVLFLVVLMSINTFAAVVGDNDGAAFITKAEFDSLKNDFQSQLDKYNSSIDNKIDGAIANYLAGIKIQATNTVTLPHSSWEKVTYMNDVIKPVFLYPGANIISTVYQSPFTNSASGAVADWQEFGVFYASLKYNQATATATNSTRPSVTGVDESAQDNLKNMTWDGIKTGWAEQINCSAFGYRQGTMYAVEVSSATPAFRFCQAFCFGNPGYKADLSSNIASIWLGEWGYGQKYNSSTMSWSNFGIPSDKSSIASYDCSYIDNTYKHVINYNDSYTWEVYNPLFKNTLRNSSIDTLSANNWFSQSKTVNSSWYHMKLYGTYAAMGPNGSSYSLKYNESVGVYNYSYNGSTTGYYCPRVGLITSTAKPSSIYQESTAVSQILDSDTYTASRMTMLDGFLLGYAKAGDQIVWQPVFNNLDSSVSGFITSTTEVSMRLSTAKWKDNLNTEGTLIPMSKVNGVASTTTEPTTKDKTVKLEFTMPSDGFIYVKWYPSGKTESQLSSNAWMIDLDLTKCGSYTRTAAD